MRLLLLLCFVVGCAPPLAYITKHGLRVRPEGTPETQESVEAATDAVIARLVEQSYWPDWKLEDVLFGLLVTVEPPPYFDCPWGLETDKCSGIVDEYAMRYVYYECIADSAFQHELIHYLIAKAGIGNFDDYHLRENTWGGPETVEGLAMKDARETVCK